MKYTRSVKYVFHIIILNHLNQLDNLKTEQYEELLQL